MAAFDEIDYTRFDVRAAVECEGVVVVDREHRDSCLEWLEREDYGIESIDFGQGIAAAVPEINELFRWKEQFGYELSADRAPVWTRSVTGSSSSFSLVGRGRSS